MPAFKCVVDEFAHVAPGKLPFGESAASVIGDVVVAPRRSEGGSLHPAFQQPHGVERPQDRVDRALLEDQPAFALGLNGLGDFVSVHFPSRAREHGQQDER